MYDSCRYLKLVGPGKEISHGILSGHESATSTLEFGRVALSSIALPFWAIRKPAFKVLRKDRDITREGRGTRIDRRA